MTTLSDWLHAKNMTHAAFGKLVDLDRSTVTKWAQGARMPRRDEMAKIASVTGGEVTAADFYDPGAPDQPEPSSASGGDTGVDMRAAG